ncbi:MAG: glutamate 5-kinase [Gammaproteobacteria bacterium]|nr:glutamate 5-kinase [Gammaproteobacteria bacterium]
MNKRKRLGKSHRWVIKIGSALLTDRGRGLDKTAIRSWVGQMAALCDRGVELILVSSGAVAEGMIRLGWSERPAELYKQQAAAAVGQMGMVQTYESLFQHHKRHTAQVLLTHNDLSDRVRYLNARSTLQTLLQLGIVPVVNENDTVVTDEIRLGDNDTLAALVANLVEAEILVILTDQPGLCESDPRQNPDAPLIREGCAGDPAFAAIAGTGGGSLGKGGMFTKVRAADLAARSGTATLIVSGRQPDVLTRIAAGEDLGTLLMPGKTPVTARKQWLGSHLQMRGKLHLDNGAVEMLRHSGKSLLAVGVTAVENNFLRGEMVACAGPDGKEVARGLVNYSARETRKIMGSPSDRIEELLGYVDEPELIHRDNLVLV